MPKVKACKGANMTQFYMYEWINCFGEEHFAFIERDMKKGTIYANNSKKKPLKFKNLKELKELSSIAMRKIKFTKLDAYGIR